MRCGSSILADFLICSRFATRLPIPAPAAEAGPHGPTDLARALRLLPAAGGLIGGLAAGVLVAGASLGLPPQLAAALAVGLLILVSGALHEDGLADCADGFGGGVTRQQKLEIMRDSRIGAFGTLALALTLYLRIAAIAAIAEQSLHLASAALVAAAALSRAAALLPLGLLSPARSSGLGFSAGKIGADALRVALPLAVLFALAPLAAGAGLARPLLSVVAVLVAALAFAAFAKREIGGHTGDVAGASQQLGEVIVYLIYAAGA
ncbi:adenosylcobinamide-GDP ribazoletransferase [Methylocapsa acidiphila]|uniref:adenosylcobinamide-GDP ribazoletransferase n=1 Tax=Methylocapsa acidiphila TaxID=133552 RepID=UPI000405BDDF|nr:adenosylcobinamide-GDP ribazoletransferase [Methylocapsa acidiphila]